MLTKIERPPMRLPIQVSKLPAHIRSAYLRDGQQESIVSHTNYEDRKTGVTTCLVEKNGNVQDVWEWLNNPQFGPNDDRRMMWSKTATDEKID